MLRNLLITISIVSSCCAFGQVTAEETAAQFDQKGLRLITNQDYSPSQIEQILQFDFESYRKENSSLIIKVVNGPHLELFSQHRKATGEFDQVSNDDHVNGDEHEHISPAEQPIKKMEIKVVDVFTSPAR